ncbi:MAG: hypothetical protein M1817_001783 [Caeruleum heppii]|nr:MAG: hypothetical protein M1817_001783 [Caeruleum heppii]
MGSVLITDLVSNTTLFPHNMRGGDTHSQQRSTPERPSRHPAPSRHSYTASPPLPSPGHVTASFTPQGASHTAPITHPSPGASRERLQALAARGQSSSSLSSAADAFPSQVPRSPQVRPADSLPPASTQIPITTITAPTPSDSSVQSTSDGRSPQCIQVKNLAHIEQLANDDMLHSRGVLSRRSQRTSDDVVTKYEISAMPVTDIIEMVAGLLTKITTTNDRQHEHIHRNIPSQEGAAGLSQQTSSVLAFHGKNVPSITILSYLSRIHKYCPTTYEVFLSLLVYFDRMTETVNSGPLQPRRRRSQSSPKEIRRDSDTFLSPNRLPGGEKPRTAHPPAETPPPSGSLVPRDRSAVPSSPSIIPESALDDDPYHLSQFFVVDSFNIHRLVIAGVTCASKFFSDVFYTNSRYAKVGGLPLIELNHLEIQFLLLNDFRLSVPVEELEAYGTMLVEFYAREVMAQKPSPSSAMEGVAGSAGTTFQNPTPP